MTRAQKSAAVLVPQVSTGYLPRATKSADAVSPARRSERLRMHETSQAQFSLAGAPPRKKNVRPVGARRPPEVLAAAGAMLRERRETARITLRGLAEKTGRSHVFLGAIERGESVVSVDLAARLAVVLDLDLAEILCAFRVVPEHAAARFFDVDRMRAALAGEQQ